MKKRKITVNIDTTYKYIQLWNGIFNLTDKELTILSSFIDVNSITEEVNMCSVRNKKEVSSMVGLKDYNTLNNYIKKLKDKGALVVSNNTYKLNTFLTPDADAIEILINRS
tara:strand:- start:2606 stop:2938 length:333 start_codon:yes stop_codon:yes gene_type:complete